MKKKQLKRALFMIPKDTEILVKVNGIYYPVEKITYRTDSDDHTYIILEAQNIVPLFKK